MKWRSTTQDWSRRRQRRRSRDMNSRILQEDRLALAPTINPILIQNLRSWSTRRLRMMIISREYKRTQRQPLSFPFLERGFLPSSHLLNQLDRIKLSAKIHTGSRWKSKRRLVEDENNGGPATYACASEYFHQEGHREPEKKRPRRLT